MSYINEALKKAQRDRDARRIRRIGIWKNIQQGNKIPKKIILYTLLSALAIGLGFMVYLRFDMAHEQQPAQLESGGHLNKVRDAANIEGSSNLPNRLVRKRVNQTSPASERVTPNTARLYNRAVNLYRQGRLQDAEKLYKDILRLDPNFSDALNDLGVIYIQRRNFFEAKECFEKAIRLQPNAVEPYYNLACLHSIKGELKEGLMQLSQAIALNPAVREWVKNDTDLVNLRGMPDFKDIIKDQTHD